MDIIFYIWLAGAALNIIILAGPFRKQLLKEHSVTSFIVLLIIVAILSVCLWAIVFADIAFRAIEKLFRRLSDRRFS
jgi:hypothetical protein